jgi:hypothetical protein
MKANTCSYTCNNSNYTVSNKGLGYSVEERIYHIIEKSNIELKPCEIARKLYAPNIPTTSQYATVRVFCSRLLKQGLVIQPYFGAYCSKITHGVRFAPVAVHNISWQANLCQKVKHHVIDEVVGGVKIHVCFGEQRRKVSGFIACDAGMSYDTCHFAIKRCFELVEGYLGFCLNDFVLTTFELNRDFSGVRVDGVSCVTRSDLSGLIERVYQKDPDLVRKEVKVSSNMSLNEFEAVLAKGFVGMGQNQGLYELRKAVEGFGSALKFNNSRLLEVERSCLALVKSQVIVKDKLVEVDDGVLRLQGDVGKLVNVLSGAISGGGVVESVGSSVSKDDSGCGGNDYVT